jgi:hypothetical protein
VKEISVAKAKTKQQRPSNNANGRPKNSPNRDVLNAAGELTRCPKCQSTQRTPYTKREVQEFGGVSQEGRPYTHIVRRWTSCASCGQHRIDRVYEHHVPERAQRK